MKVSCAMPWKLIQKSLIVPWIDAFKCSQCFNGYKIERNHSYECSECGATSTSEEIFRTVSSIQDEAEDIINAGMLEFGKSYWKRHC